MARSRGVAVLVAAAIAAAAGLALAMVMVSVGGQATRAVSTAEGKQTELLGTAQGSGSVGTPFKMTKWGPLRSKKWQSSRYRVLALWEAASRSLESCMDAENFVFPHAQDSSCRDVVRTFNGVRQCMRHQRDGLRGLADGKQGAWEALSTIVDETKALGEEDREMVSRKISGDAALYTLARLDALHARCSQAGQARGSSKRFAPLMYDPRDAVFQAERTVGYVRGQEKPPPLGQARAAGEWPIRVDMSDMPRVAKGAYRVKRDGWDSIRRASRRGYIEARPDEAQVAHS